jgi:hypothetical protein
MAVIWGSSRGDYMYDTQEVPFSMTIESFWYTIIMIRFDSVASRGIGKYASVCLQISIGKCGKKTDVTARWQKIR